MVAALGQRPVHGRVIDGTTNAPVAARVRALASDRSVATTPDGRFVIELVGTGDSLVITAIGYTSERIAVAPGDSLTIRLHVTTQLGDLMVEAARPADRLGTSGRSVLSDSTARVLPLSLEPDVFRPLNAFPSVSFSSVLSARPMLQGGEADDTGFAIDDHQVMNPFHTGRFFAAFPSIAVGETTVELLPGAQDIGHTATGRINIRGKEWHAGRSSEIQYGLGAWSALTGTSNRFGNFTLAGRTIRGALAGAVASVSDVEFNLYDLYGRGTIADGRAVLTAHRARNRASEPLTASDPEPAFLDAGHWLLGLDAVVLRRTGHELRVRASSSTHTQASNDTDARNTSVNLDTRLSRTGALLGYRGTPGNDVSIDLGAGLHRRAVANRLTPDNPYAMPPAETDISGLEVEGRAAVSVPVGKAILRAGVRVDAFHGELSVQPRGSFRVPLSGQRWLELSGGRASRLIHQVSDANTDPEVAMYDYWLVAGQPGAQIAHSDHVAIEYGTTLGAGGFRIRGFGSSGSGRIDLERDGIPRSAPLGFRSGRVRVIGAEAALLLRNATGSRELQAAYTLMRSERDWGAGWIPARGDRPHRFRVNGMSGLGSGFVLAGTLEASSGVPFTPVRQFYPTRIIGEENSGRGAWGVRLDAALTHDFGGPWGTTMTLGASISNLSIGDQVIRESVPDTNVDGTLNGLVRNKPVFWIPPFPSVILRVRW